MENFDFSAPAEMFAITWGKRPHFMTYRRFSTGAEAIRHVMEILHADMRRGTIVETGVDKHAGLYHLIVGDDGATWGLGHHSAFVRRGGRVERGDVIAYMGMSGGAKGVHVHIFRAPTLANARRQITGYVNYRKGRTIAEWAASMGGLTDPYPHIVAQWAAAERELAAEIAAAKAAADRAAAEASEQREDDDMIVIENTDTGHVYAAAKQFLRHETHRPAGERTAKLLTSAGEIVKLNGNDFREVLNALGIPLAAERGVLEGKLWSPHAGIIDARTLDV